MEASTFSSSESSTPPSPFSTALQKSSKVGTRVVRGPDWTTGDEDGGEGSLGWVTNVDSWNQVVCVLWENGNSAKYRAGVGQKHDLIEFDSTNTGK